jgi:hypothetical protein
MAPLVAFCGSSMLIFSMYGAGFATIPGKSSFGPQRATVDARRVWTGRGCNGAIHAYYASDAFRPLHCMHIIYLLSNITFCFRFICCRQLIWRTRLERLMLVEYTPD